MPAPWGTTVIRLTNGSDMHGLDALNPTGYSYWQATNAHAHEDHLVVFLCCDRNRGGEGPSLWSVEKSTDRVTPLGPIFSPNHALSWSTGEGFYFSATEPHILYASDLTHLYRVDVSPVLAGTGTGTITTVVDVAEDFPGLIAWQWHSAQSGAIHSATLKDASTYAPLAAAVFPEGGRAQYYAATRQYDECQLDQSGGWLLIKENLDGKSGEDNLIYRLGGEGDPRTLYDEEGAAGHSDNGFGYMVAADNWNSKPSAFRVWNFDATQEPSGRLVYYTADWSAQLGHVSHCNARNAGCDSQYVLGSTASRTLAPRNNEIIAFKLDGACEVLVIAPVLTNLDAPGGGSDDYAKLPKANIDVTGQYALWTSNAGGDRLDAFLVKVPAQLLVPTPPPSQPVYTVTAPDGTIRKFVEVA